MAGIIKSPRITEDTVYRVNTRYDPKPGALRQLLDAGNVQIDSPALRDAVMGCDSLKELTDAAETLSKMDLTDQQRVSLAMLFLYFNTSRPDPDYVRTMRELNCAASTTRMVNKCLDMLKPPLWDLLSEIDTSNCQNARCIDGTVEIDYPCLVAVWNQVYKRVDKTNTDQLLEWLDKRQPDMTKDECHLYRSVRSIACSLNGAGIDFETFSKSHPNAWQQISQAVDSGPAECRCDTCQDCSRDICHNMRNCRIGLRIQSVADRVNKEYDMEIAAAAAANATLSIKPSQENVEPTITQETTTKLETTPTQETPAASEETPTQNPDCHDGICILEDVADVADDDNNDTFQDSHSVIGSDVDAHSRVDSELDDEGEGEGEGDGDGDEDDFLSVVDSDVDTRSRVDSEIDGVDEDDDFLSVVGSDVDSRSRVDSEVDD